MWYLLSGKARYGRGGFVSHKPWVNILDQNQASAEAYEMSHVQLDQHEIRVSEKLF